MEEADIRWVGNLMLEEHRKLMRYEQRAVNQIRKALLASENNKTNPKWRVCEVVIKGFIAT